MDQQLPGWFLQTGVTGTEKCLDFQTFLDPQSVDIEGEEDGWHTSIKECLSSRRSLCDVMHDFDVMIWRAGADQAC